MTRTMMTAVACAALLTLSPAAADAAKQLKKGPVKLDPKLGYVLARIGPAKVKNGHSMLVSLGRFDAKTGDLRRADRKNKPPKGDDNGAAIGGTRSFVVGEKTGSFVTSLTPGDWVIEGVDWTCFCLGSYRFTVKAGEIVDLGTILVGMEDGKSPIPELAALSLPDDLLDRPFTVPSVMLVRPADAQSAVPAELAGLPLRPADYQIDVRFSNLSGHLINRAAGLPAFTRPQDKPVPAETAAPAASTSSQ